ncbi:MAG: YihA family ribosome biogenesis GTP-binding protein [Solobacterium sp.]|nr:YihA family ribosome biogenesis GTP-binding protein [Solobacterium sp.]
MQYYDAKYVASAVNPSQYPDTDLIEIVFAGRSNAGKSSLINALVNRKNLAYEGKTPGKTRMLNFFEIDGRFMFTDAPGYGYAKGGVKTSLAFGEIMEPYFQLRKPLKALVLVLDIRREPNEDDLRMIEYAKESHLSILCALTKSDKLSYSQQLQSIQKIVKILGIRKESAFPISSLKKTGLENLWEAIENLE